MRPVGTSSHGQPHCVREEPFRAHPYAQRSMRGLSLHVPTGRVGGKRSLLLRTLSLCTVTRCLSRHSRVGTQSWARPPLNPRGSPTAPPQCTLVAQGDTQSCATPFQRTCCAVPSTCSRPPRTCCAPRLLRSGRLLRPSQSNTRAPGQAFPSAERSSTPSAWSQRDFFTATIP